MLNFLAKFLNSNDKEIKRLSPLVEKINSLEAEIKKLPDKDFPQQTEKLKDQLTSGKGLDELLPQAYALVREASFRVNKERHFDVQVLAAIALHQGKIAEQKTGEGKTLTATMPLYLNALLGKGVHLVTVNDYLARVGIGWTGPIYDLLGLSCAAIIHDQSYLFDPEFTDETGSDWRLRHLRPITRKEAYAADITYGINSEFGFDYLRDNMARSLEEVVQRDFTFAIVDEADSVLIDEARTPHIISQPDMEPTKKYYDYAAAANNLSNKLDYVVDEKQRSVHLTDHGISKIEQFMGVKNIYETDFAAVHHVEAALKAKTLFLREKDYIVRDNQVVIVDEFTGRLMPGRRWSEGIHQALEAKEGVPIQQESKTLATVSLQNYFRKYKKLAGMTGTAATEAEEFHKIYKLEVVVIPTHRQMVRNDKQDQVYKTQRAKYAAVVHNIEEMHKIGRPVLVGTTSIEKNEILTQFLRHRGISHQILNAKQHEKEAMIISQAGRKGAVTVATNMAGRGVDIILGGNTPKYEDGRPMLDTPEWNQWQKNHDEVVSLGGLHVIGTERHESRRIDNQLRGRAGRQGDPGSSTFFLALDDDLMRIFGGDQVAKMMTFFNIPEDQVLEHGIVNRSIEQAQSKVEQFHFDSRKSTVEFDDVMNQQREIIYRMRRKILERNASGSDEEIKQDILNRIEKEISQIVDMNVATSLDADVVHQEVVDQFSTIIPFDDNSKTAIKEQLDTKADLLEKTELLVKVAKDVYETREKQIGSEVARYIEKQESLASIDLLWMEHLEAIDDLRSAINLRRHAQRDPLVEYKTEAFAMFERLIAAIDSELVHRIYKITVLAPEPKQPQSAIVTNAEQIENLAGPAVTAPSNMMPDLSGDVRSGLPVSSQGVVPSQALSKRTLGRNDPCWCGSGKKYKKCHYPN